MSTASREVVERALAEVAKTRAVRERHLALRLEMQRKAAEITNRPPVYILKKYGGHQLPLGLEGGHAVRGERH